MEYKFGGQTFRNCAVPAIVGDRVIVVEPGRGDPLVSVLAKGADGKATAEVLRNRPGDPTTDVNVSESTGIVSVAAKSGSGTWLYKVRPGSTTSITFGSLAVGERQLRIRDRTLTVLDGGGKGVAGLEGLAIDGFPVGVYLGASGEFLLGLMAFPPDIAAWLV